MSTSNNNFKNGVRFRVKYDYFLFIWGVEDKKKTSSIAHEEKNSSFFKSFAVLEFLLHFVCLLKERSSFRISLSLDTYD